MNREAMEDILNSLKTIKENGPKLQLSGICSNVFAFVKNSNFDDAHSFLQETFPKWKHFSGDKDFPVPFGKLDPSDAYVRENKWEGKYGEKRIKLLNFLIKTAKSELKCL